MRVRISVDSATTPQIRALMVALHHVGMTGELKTGVNGPECWEGETPHLSLTQFASVAAQIAPVSAYLTGGPVVCENKL